MFTPAQEDADPGGSVTVHRACLVLIRESGRLDRRLTELAWMLGGVFGLAMLVSAGGMALVVTKGLAPLNTLADRIHAIGVTDLSERIRLDESPEEMRPVVERLNGLLSNVESALARERAFTADVAHELRTPLAGLTTTLEVCGRRSRTVTEYEQVLGRCLKAARQMQAMVENLLLVARADANQVQPHCEQVDIGATAASELAIV